MRTNVIALNLIRRYHPITVLLIFENMFYLEKNVSSCVIFHLKFLYLYDFWLKKSSLNTVSYSSLFMLYDLSDEMWDVENLVCQGNGILGMWDNGDVRCWGYGILGAWDIRDVECSGCGMSGMWNVRDVECSGCGMCGMWDARDVGCRIFAGM